MNSAGKKLLSGAVIILFITFAGALQVMVALTISLVQIRMNDATNKPNLILYFLGLLFLFLVLLSINLFCKNKLCVTLLFALFGNIVAVIDYYELLFHGTVLTHQDIKNIFTAARQLNHYTFRLTPAIICILLSFLILVFILGVIHFQHLEMKTNKKMSGISLSLFLILSYLLVFSPVAIIKKDGWSWELKYYRDSFVIGTMENISRTVNPYLKPDEYGDAEISNVAGLSGKTQDYPDIILILNETYYDIDHLLDYNSDISFMHNYDTLDAYKGYSSVPFIGGGTNASEYELLTGNALTLLNTSTPFNDLDFADAHSLVDYLEKFGYVTLAAHPDRSSNYHRGIVWPRIGFDAVFFYSDFSNLERIGNRWPPSDSSVFRNFRDYYETLSDNQPRFAYLLTIQNHGDWDSNEPEMDLVHIQKNNGLSDYNCQRMNEYLTCIKQTDDCIAEIIDYFSGIDRKVIVYMVGDHGPSFLSNIFGDEHDDTMNLKKRQVPYFIWANYDIDFSGLPEDHDIDLCALSACVLQSAGLPLSPYICQLITISKNVKCLTGIESVNESEDSAICFMYKDGHIESIYDETQVAEDVKKYYFMEYNNLQVKQRMNQLFDPGTN